MYQGIGLTTPRGSGTNGHVQRNLAYIPPKRLVGVSMFNLTDVKPPKPRKPNKEILEHEKKRKMELQCITYREALTKRGYSEDEIKTKLDSFIQKLEYQNNDPISSSAETHSISLKKERELENIRIAFGIKEDHVEGEVFDFEAQEQKRYEKKQEKTTAPAKKYLDRRDQEKEKGKKDKDKRDKDKDRRDKSPHHHHKRHKHKD